LFCFSTLHAEAQTQPFSDALCPDVVPYAVALGKLKPNDEPQLVYDAAHAVQIAYETCAKRYLSGQNAEGAHYGATREAYYGIVQARALVQLGRPGDARAELERDRAIAQDVADWTPSGAANAAQQSGAKYSRFRESAQNLVGAANAELARLASVASPTSSAVPSASP
jgi:hypothetical protein